MYFEGMQQYIPGRFMPVATGTPSMVIGRLLQKLAGHSLGNPKGLT